MLSDSEIQYLKAVEASARDRHIPVLLGDSAEYLLKYTEELQPRRILEIGTAIGYSGMLMLLTSRGATLDTIERDGERVAEAREHFAHMCVTDRVHIYEGDSRDILPTLRDNRYDLIFMDGGKSRYQEDILMLEGMLSDNGIIFADNVLFKGLVQRAGTPNHRVRTMVNNLRKYLSIVEEQADYETELFEIGDGITITRKKK